MNPDVPSLEACKRLARAGYGCPARHSYRKATGRMQVMTGEPIALGVAQALGDLLAPTIGEMLAEVRRRGWAYIIRHGMDSALCEVEVRRRDKGGNFPTSKANSATHEEPKEALANALAEAMEKEKK